MSNPSFQAQQAAQQASQQAQRAAAQASAASRHAYPRGNPGADASRRAMLNHSYRRSAAGSAFDLLGRLIGFVIALAIIAVVGAMFLSVAGRGDPGLLDHLKSWLARH